VNFGRVAAALALVLPLARPCAAAVKWVASAESPSPHTLGEFTLQEARRRAATRKPDRAPAAARLRDVLAVADWTDPRREVTVYVTTDPRDPTADGVRRSVWSFSGPAGSWQAEVWLPPTAGAARVPAVLGVPGLFAGAATSASVWAEALARDGYAVVVPGLTGGESDAEALNDALNLLIVGRTWAGVQTAQVLWTFDYMTRADAVDPARIAILGQGAGALIGAYAAVLEGRVAALAVDGTLAEDETFEYAPQVMAPDLYGVELGRRLPRVLHPRPVFALRLRSDATEALRTWLAESLSPGRKASPSAPTDMPDPYRGPVEQAFAAFKSPPETGAGDDARGLLRRFQSDVRAGRRKEAKVSLDRLAELQPFNGAVLRWLVQWDAEDGKPEAGAARYRNYLDRFPEDVEVRRDFVQYLVKQRLHDRADKELRDWMLLEPSDIRPWRELAALELARGRSAQAIDAHRTIVRMSPETFPYRVALAKLLEDEGRWADAEAALLAGGIADTGAQGLVHLAGLQEKQSKWTAARASYEAALRLEPSSEVSRSRLGSVLTKLDRWAEAEAVLSEAGTVKLTAASRMTLAEVQEKLGKWAEARKNYEHVLKTEPRHATARVNLVYCLHRLGLAEEAARVAAFRSEDAVPDEKQRTFQRYRNPSPPEAGSGPSR
jgi:tetratricopeptide (TPR) repeat protein